MIPVELMSKQRIKVELSECQQEHLDKARDLAALHGAEQIRDSTECTDLGMAYAVALGRAQWELRELLAIIAELTGAER